MRVTCPKCKRRIRLIKSRKITCKCGHEFPFKTYFGEERIYLLDANVIIYALNKKSGHYKSCKKFLSMPNFATTERVMNEIKQNLETRLKIYKVKEVSSELKELKSIKIKQPSEKDLSLIQAAIDHPEIGGIITYDQDFKAIATSGFIQSKSSKFASQFFVGNAEVFQKKFSQYEFF
jgi:rRNA-processing protein FCF1